MTRTDQRPATIKIGESSITPPSIVRAETNFLRFPFFALSTKNIHKIDFREVTGTRKINAETGESNSVDFTYRVSRNTDHVFPGQLSRKIHFALLSIMAKQGPIPVNPIRFTWRQLAREMVISYGGSKMTRDMKQAIRSTHGTIIRTDHALIDGTLDGRATIKRERGLHLYEDYRFQGETLLDGSTVDRNEVKLSDWYFNNLKARYIQPLDFDLWLKLNRQTPVASRLYEYLVFVFGNNSFRQISYQKLAASLPLTELKEKGRIKQQLEPAFKALRSSRLLKRTIWGNGKYGNVMISFEKGESMKPVKSSLACIEEEPEEIATTESFNEISPTDRFVCDYYEKRFGIEHSVNSKEREFVGKLIERYGYEHLDRQLSKLVRRMKQEFPSGMSIMACSTILQQMLAAKVKKPPSDESTPSDERKEEDLQRRKLRREQLESQWGTLGRQQQDSVELLVTARLGKKSNSSGFRLMVLHEANRLFFES